MAPAVGVKSPGRVTKASLDNELEQTRKASGSAANVYYRDDIHTSNEIALLWLDILHRIDAVDASTLAVFSQWKADLKRPLSAPTLTALARLCSQKEATKTVALRFALEAFNLMKNERDDAENKADGYIDAARAILTVSKSDADALFFEAVEVASKIGDENLSRWDAILDLADRAARGDRSTPEEAYHFARCAELTYDYVARDKYFNWHATVEALCGLCASSALAILSRWRDRGFGWSERILPIAVQCLIERGSLDPRDALPLIGFRAQWSYDQLTDSVLAACTTPDEKEVATAYLYRYMQFNGGNFLKLKEITSRHGVMIDDLDEAIAFDEIEKRAGKKPEYKQVEEPNDVLARSARNWDGVFADWDPTNADGLARAYSTFKSAEPPWNHDQFFKKRSGASQLVPKQPSSRL